MKSRRRHDLKHDQIADILGGIWEYIVLHRAKAILVLVLLAVAVGLATWIYTVRSMAHAEAEDRLAEAQDAIWQIEALRQEDREQAAALSGKVISDLTDVAQEFPGTPAAALALFKAGRLSLEEDRHEAAAQTFREVVALAPNRPNLRRMARQNLAAALEEAGDHTAALAEYTALAANGSPHARAKAHWDMGRIREVLGDIRDALDAYGEAVRTAPGSEWAEQALDRSRALQEPAAPVGDEAAALTEDAPDANKTESEGDEAGASPAPEAPDAEEAADEDAPEED